MSKRKRCQVCGDTFEDGHALVDHMADDHNAFTAVMNGRYPTNA